jgi:hypothetical protein
MFFVSGIATELIGWFLASPLFSLTRDATECDSYHVGRIGFQLAAFGDLKK